MISEVKPGSPAESAGMQPGDIVLSYDSRAIRSMNQLFALVKKSTPGQSVPVVVFRGGQQFGLDVVISSLQEVRNQRSLGDMDRIGRFTSGLQDFSEAMGMEVANFTPMMRTQMQLLPGSPGILVTQVVDGSQLSGQLQEGDVIERLNDSFIFDVNDFHNKLNSIEAGVQLTIWFKRAGADKSVTIQRVE